MISAPLEKRRRKKRKRLPVYKKKFSKPNSWVLGGRGEVLVIHLKNIGSYIKKVNNIGNIERAGSRADQS